MYKANKIITAIIALLFTVGVMPGASAQESNKNSKRNEAFDPVEFIKRFKIGMSYTEVQQALPKNVDQDILSYLTTEDAFLLSIDLPASSNWSASFKFDTLDVTMRRPEKLVELSCSAGLSSRSESFESIVHKVTEAFGEPLKIDRTEDKYQQAGWRVSGGSVLMLEYSVVPNGVGNNVSVEFIIKKNPRHDATPSRAIA
jgi:hypothetical protein